MFGIYDKREERLLLFQIMLTVLSVIVELCICRMFRVNIYGTLCIVTVSLAIGIAGLLTVFFFLHSQKKRLEEATKIVASFMKGDSTVRLESSEEGQLAKFFEEINHMALFLHTHLEKEKDAKDFLKKLISDISHQLKTPVAAIRMYNEIMENEKDNPQTIENFTGKTEKSLERMECLIQNLLKIAKLDAGTIVLEKKTFEVFSLLEEITEEYTTAAQLEGKKIAVQNNEGELVLLFADLSWTAECVRNLVQNALTHMNQGDKVTLSCVVNPVFVEIIVKDTGTGIHPEDIHHIFKRFYRSRFSQNTQGVGLGLSLVKAILQAHGGTVSVDSTVGEGSTFTLYFPNNGLSDKIVR